MFSKAAIAKDKTIILFCSTGVGAGKTLFGLTSMLNYLVVKAYDNR